MQKRFGIIAGFLVFVLIALLPLDATAIPPEAQLTAAIAGLMIVWWITEAIPIFATALLPLVLFPLFGILSPTEAAVAYADQVVFLFLGGFLIAAAMQRWNLHRRIALHIIAVSGNSSRKLVLGFMAATAFLSMWISNTATAMLMIPIAVALVSTMMPDAFSRDKSSSTGEKSFASCLILGVAYAATIGGIATLIGTPPNGVLVAQLSTIYPEAPPIDFFSWMVFAVPLMVLLLAITWFWLTLVIHRDLPSTLEAGRFLISEELAKLGSLTRGERWTLLVFVVVALAWIFRLPKEIGDLTIPGITTVLPGVTDATIAVAGALALFLLPVDSRNGIYTLDWESAVRIPWGILILFGGGICLSEGIIESGLAGVIAGSLGVLAVLPLVLIVLILALVISFLNEVVSNTAIASIMIPLLAIASIPLGINPMVLMVTAALASSLGFMLPVGTPPNAIAYGTGCMTTRDMVRSGFSLNIISAVLVTVFMTFIVPSVLGFSPTEVPAWAIIQT
jgi:sodium-dependent dicarboxylate transporter 2/3/5